MKTIILFLILPTLIFSQSGCFAIKSNNINIFFNNLPSQYNKIFFKKYLIQGKMETIKSINLTSFSNISSDSTIHKSQNIFLSGLEGSLVLGLAGAFLGYNAKTECSGSSDVFKICSGSGHYARLGVTIGGVSGSILGYLSQRKNISQRFPVLRIVIGSITGGVIGYFLTDVTFGMSAIIFPPLGANILLHF